MNFYRPTSDKVKLYSSDPLLGVVEDFLNEEECSLIIESAKGKLESSRTQSGTGVPPTLRTSSSAHIGEEQEVRRMVSSKIKDSFSFEEDELESLQVVHYENGESFDVHHDSASYGGPEFDSGEIAFAPIPRIATILIYLNTLNDMKTGAEASEGLTVFPNIGYAVRPRRGRAVIFYNFSDEGIVDFRAMHTGFPVNISEKWALNAWIADLNLDTSEYITNSFVKKEFAKIKQPDKLNIIL